ncbi:Glyoxylate reductase 1 [Yarrowia sp. C11]|nr:Glyoxylate reductase 1 [Yarrowia sp. E02]KAG5367797.1 Glyoxylate reductase 1 [Yarrowia sp. C11]
MAKVLFLDEIHDATKDYEALSKKCEIQHVDKTTREEFLKDCKDGKYDGFVAIYRTFTTLGKVGRFDKELCDALPSSIKAVCHYGAGYDQVDVAPFTERGIQVSNVQGAADAATALTNVYLMLGCLRNFGYAAISLREEKWIGDVPLGHDPDGKVLGIMGMGGIGRQVRDYVKPFGFEKIIYYNRSRLSPELEGGCEYVTLDELYAQADVISVNVPLNAATRHMINAESIAKMKDGVVIVNTARGPVIDEQALVDGLNSGKISSAGLDVYEHEPKINPGLLKNPNTLLLPHFGTFTIETHRKMEEAVLNNIETFLETGKVATIVPEQNGKF